MDDATKEDLLAILNEKQEEIEWLKAELDEANHSRELSDADCVTLRSERDEARRKICEMEAECIVYPPCSPQQYAVRMNWDCFSDKTEADANNTLFCTTDGE